MAVKWTSGKFERRREENSQKRIDITRREKLKKQIEEKLKELAETNQHLRSVK